MRYLLVAAAAAAGLALVLVLFFLRQETDASNAPAPTAPELSSSAMTSHQRICRSYLETINGDHKAWVGWTSRGDEVTVQINSGYFQLSSEVTQNVNEALRCAAAADANDIAVVKYEDEGTQQRVLEWKQATGFRALQ